MGPQVNCFENLDTRGRRLPHQQLRALPRTCIRRLCVQLRSSALRHWGVRADRLAPRIRRQRSTMEGAGQRSGGVHPHIKAAVYSNMGH